MLPNMIDGYIELLVKRKMISSDQVEDYKYQAICFVESTIVIGAMILVGIIFKQFVNVCIFIICFFNIRNRAGGFHLDTFWQCFFGTISMECLVAVLVRYMSDKIYVLDCAALVSFAIIFIIGALNHPNINYSKEEYIVIKKQSRIVVSVICFIIAFLKVLHASVETIMYMEYAVIMSAVLLILEYRIRKPKNGHDRTSIWKNSI